MVSIKEKNKICNMCVDFTIFKNGLAEKVNDFLVMSDLKPYRLNNNILINIVVRSCLDYLKTMSSDDVTLFLSNGIIDCSIGGDYE